MAGKALSRRPGAPLAQLRAADPEVWSAIHGATRSDNPGSDAVTQALAAALLGDVVLARRIVADGPWLPEWPDLVKNAGRLTRRRFER